MAALFYHQQSQRLASEETMLKRPQTVFYIRPEFGQNIRDCIVAELHAETFNALRSRLAVGIIPSSNGVDSDIAGDLCDIESRLAIIPAGDENPRSRIVSSAPESAGSEPKVSRIVVEQAGQDRVSDITADDLVTESASIVFTESPQTAVMVESAGRDLRLRGVASQQKEIRPVKTILERNVVFLGRSEWFISFQGVGSAVIGNDAEEAV